jgi:tetratricopeptide (TPR) repeat protein
MGFESESEREPLTSEQELALKQAILARAPGALAKFESATTDADRFYALPDAAMAAYHLERYPLAADLAAKSLEMSASFRNDWNYGNAIHAGRTVLGLLALRQGNSQLAVQELHKAGATPGSPQLDSFGPTMQLAKALLRAGESKAVLAYLEQCRVFWKMGEPWLTIWEERIRAGGVPNFFMHLW